MRLLARLLAKLAMLFNLGVAVFLLGLVVLSGGQHNIQLAALPWEGEKLTRYLLGAAIYALAALLLGLGKRHWTRLPMLLWNLALPAVFLLALARSSFSFESQEQIRLGAYWLGASLVALWGSWLHWRAARQGRRAAR